jgi:hypothetical protein
VFDIAEKMPSMQRFVGSAATGHPWRIDEFATCADRGRAEAEPA